MKKILSMIFLICLLAACATQPALKSVPQEVVVKVQAVDPAKVEIEQNRPEIQKTMSIDNVEGSLSGFTKIFGDAAYMQIYSGIGTYDAKSIAADIFYLRFHGITQIELYLNSPGGGAFDGIAIADELERAQRSGISVQVHASGIIASAAVPVFAVCEPRIAAPGTIFMIHQPSVWKFMAVENASDIRSQNDMMSLLQERYYEKLAAHSKLSAAEWATMAESTKWFDVKQALQWGLVDKPE